MYTILYTLFYEKSRYILIHVYIYFNFKGKDINIAYDNINKEFQEKYPGHILPEEDQQWIFMNAGGWMGSMKILHASLTEYVLLFGTAINTSGNSGIFYFSYIFSIPNLLFTP